MINAVYQVVEYVGVRGRSPYAEWFEDLDNMAAVKVSVALVKIMQGNLSNVKWFKGIGEYKINFGPGYRIYFAKEEENIILLLGGGTKKTQQKDIEQARFLWQEYKYRRN